MVSRNVTIAVDEKFFKDIFEKQRKQLQEKIGVLNLSQPNFTRMIKGFKIITFKEDISNFKLKRGRKKNDFLKI